MRNNRRVSGYADIHAHVLPGIDDGPAELEGTLALIRAAAAAGISTLAATPHLRADFPDVRVGELAERCAAVREAMSGERLAVEIVPGAEVSLTWALEAGENDLRLASYHQRGTDLLVEAPSIEVPRLDALLYTLRVRGLRITLAHPERVPQFQADQAPLRDLVTQGVLLQVNAGSLIPGHGSQRARRLAEELCTQGLAHVIASDGHRDASWRPISVFAAGVGALSELVGLERAEWMASTAPLAILRGAELPSAPAIVQKRRWRVFGGG